MNKTSLIDYLNKQCSADNKIISFEADKQGIISVLDDIFGLENKYTLQLQKIESIKKESLDELYPKMLTDEVKSAENFRLVLLKTIEQIDLLEPEILIKNETAKIRNNKIYKALQNYFSEVEISKIKLLVTDKNTNKNDLLEHLRVIETDKRLNLLAEMLNDKKIY